MEPTQDQFAQSLGLDTVSNQEHEDRRTAAGISVSLSSQLISAALAMLAIEGAVVVFVVGERNPNPIFWIVAVCSFVAFVVSIFVAGKGITKDRDNGANGNWNTNEASKLYNAQAISCLIGLILFIVSFSLIGKSQDFELREELAKLRTDLYQLSRDITQKTQSQQDSIELLKMGNSLLGDKLNKLSPVEQDVAQITSKIQELIQQKTASDAQLQNRLQRLENELTQIQERLNAPLKPTEKP